MPNERGQSICIGKQKTPKPLNGLTYCLKILTVMGMMGLEKPEKLRHREGWSRRIDDINRLVYQLKDDGTVEVMQCKGHYDD